MNQLYALSSISNHFLPNCHISHTISYCLSLCLLWSPSSMFNIHLIHCLDHLTCASVERLYICLYHLNLDSLVFSSIEVIPTYLLLCSFLILYFFVCPQIHLNIPFLPLGWKNQTQWTAKRRYLCLTALPDKTPPYARFTVQFLESLDLLHSAGLR